MNKNIIELLENEYLKEYQLFDELIDNANKERGLARLDETATGQQNHNWNAERYMNEAKTHAAIICKLAEIFAEINGTSFDKESERLHNKFNLWRK